MKNKWVFCALALVAVSVRAETIDELDLSADQTIEVAAGTTNRIEYLSGTAAATLTKTGLGTLEIAVFGNTNATIRVAEGALKAVRPARIALNGNVYFHLDATDAQARTVSESGGTNFITQLADSAGGALVANRVGSLPCPYVGDRTLNGLPVYDFGVYSKVSSTQGAAMQVSAPAIINELFYVWEDREGTKDAVAADTLGPNAVNMRYSYRGLGGSGQDFKLFYTAHGQITDTITIDGVKTASSTPVTEGWHLAAWWANKPITSPVEDYGFYGFGFCPNGLAGYGGVRIAEVIACSTTNTVAQRLRVNRYLQQKWFGGLPVKFLSLRSGGDARHVRCAVECRDA